jgi:hypothetical protein
MLGNVPFGHGCGVSSTTNLQVGTVEGGGSAVLRTLAAKSS